MKPHPQMVTIKKRVSSILIWSVISAAFIGPGTLAASSSAGALFKYDLIWALIFATVACIVLQEMAARISIVSGENLSTILRHNSSRFLTYFIGLAVVLGCAAYEAGNILGAFSGISVVFPVNRYLAISCIGGGAIFLLGFGGRSTVTKVLGALVGIMGVVFVVVALKSSHTISDLLTGTIPSIPEGAGWLTLALVGTTIVPYNIYLGSNLSEGQSLKEMRFGLVVSIIFGGLISIAILITATQIGRMDSFIDMARLLGETLGYWAYILLGAGLFAAGFTSSVTAPMASGLITQGLFEKSNGYSFRGYRIGWFVVLSVGLIFGVLDIKPLPVIVAAQALNGFILPLLGVILIVSANDAKRMGNQMNSAFLNLMAFVVLEVLLLLGFNGLWNTLGQFISLPSSNLSKFTIIQTFAFFLLLYTGILVYRRRRFD